MCLYLTWPRTSYEDLLKDGPLDPDTDKVRSIYFNGVSMIRRKVRHGLDRGLGGVMIWEVGQDCRLAPTVRGETTHVVTCPEGDDSSLLVAIAREKSRALDASSTSKPKSEL